VLITMIRGLVCGAASLWLFVPTNAQAPPAKACVNPTCASPPCKAPLLGDVGCTTVSGTEAYANGFIAKGGAIASAGHIFGPFEAGFGVRQKSIIEGWGCTDASVAYDDEGGTDIGAAEAAVSKHCGISLPRVEGNNWVGIVGPCGGHTKDYHFHRSFSCLYQQVGGHSTAVGDIAQWKMYGKWEDYANKKLPYLDACGGHFGVTPDSNGAIVYHYHVQDRAPYTVGCYGPTADGKLVSVAACRGLYTECSASASTLATATGTRSYVRFCPCYDADGSNSGTPKELPALSTSDISYTDSSGSTNSFGTHYSICTSATSCSSVVAAAGTFASTSTATTGTTGTSSSAAAAAATGTTSTSTNNGRAQSGIGPATIVGVFLATIVVG
jgi:hypothetical protein